MTPASPAPCSSFEEQRRKPCPVSRMVGMERAAELLGRGGQREIATVLGIEPRALRYKTAGRSGIDDVDLTITADFLDTRAARMIELARKLRQEAVGR